MNTGTVSTLGSWAPTVMYGCSPIEIGDPKPWQDPFNPWMPGAVPQRYLPAATIPFEACVRCGRHARLNEPCPFCMRDDIARLEKRIDEALKATPPEPQAPPPEPARKKKKVKKRKTK